MAKRHFNEPVDTIEGTVKSASAQGIELAEYPGRTFRFSSVGTTMADLTAEMLGDDQVPLPPAHIFSRAGGRGQQNRSAALRSLLKRPGTPALSVFPVLLSTENGTEAAGMILAG